MKAIAYSVKPFEQEFIAKANQKKHDITLIFNALDDDTLKYAAGKQAVIIGTSDEIPAGVIEKLANFGVKYISIRTASYNHIDKGAAVLHGIKLGTIPEYCGSQEIALQTIKNLDLWELNKCLGKNCACVKGCKL